MLEVNFIQHLKAKFPEIPVYSFFIPDTAPDTAFCFENAGSGVATQYTDGNEIQVRTIKLTLSTNDIEKLYRSGEVNKYFRTSSVLGEMPIINARVMSFHDNFVEDISLYERTFTIQIKFLEV